MSDPLPTTAGHDTATDAAGHDADVPGYAVEGLLGRGGMGVVFLARDLALNRPVALKMVRGPAGAKDLARFLAEAEAVAAVDHPHVVRVFRCGEHAGRPFLALEYLPGGTLADRLRGPDPGGPGVRLAPRDAAALVGRVAGGVAAAHAQGIVHRDLKPGNVLFDAAGGPKVADFGLAKRAASDMTSTQAVMGTPAYMAPEQAAGGTKFVGPPADVWALGVILYECLTGGRPFAADSTADLLARVILADPPPPSRAAAGVPRDLERVCLKCLEKDPRDRYPAAAELAEDLRRFAAGEPVSVRAPGAAERVAKWVRRRPTAAAAVTAAAAAAALLVVASVVGWLWRDAEGARARAIAARADAVRERDRVAAIEYGRVVQLADQSLRDNKLARARALLADTDPKLRGWEYGYVHRLCHADLRTLPAIGAASVAWAPDGRLAAGDSDGVVRVWDPATGAVLHTLRGHTSTVTAVAWAPDGRALASGALDDTARLWDAATGAARATLRGHTSAVDAVAFGPDGTRLLTAGRDNTVRVWDVATGAVATTLPAGSRVRVGAAWSPDGRRVATAGVTPTVWDVATGKAVQEFRGHSPVAVPYFVTTAVGFSPDGTRLVTGGYDDTARVWEVATGRELHALSGHQRASELGGVVAVAFSPDGSRVLTASYDTTARIWDGVTATRPPAAPAGLSWWSGVWNAQTMAQVHALRGHVAPVRAAAWSADGTRVATAAADGVRVWDTAAGADGLALRASAESLRAVAWAPDGTRFATAGDDKTAAAWDAATGRRVARFTGHRAEVRAVAFGPSGGVLTGSADRTAGLWEGATGTRSASLRHPAPVGAVAPRPGGAHLATASADGVVTVWDVARGDEAARLRGHPSAVDAVAWSPDGKRLLSGGRNGAVRVWAADTWAELPGPAAGVTPDAIVAAVAWSPDGTLAAAAADEEVVVWDTTDWATVATLRGYSWTVSGLSFSPDGSRLAAATRDHAVKVWDPRAGAELLTLRVPSGAVWDVAFSPDGARLLAATGAGNAVVWDSAPVRPPDPAAAKGRPDGTGRRS